MKQGEGVRSSNDIILGRPAGTANGGSPAGTSRKPVGPMTYQVSRGSDVFWSGKASPKPAGPDLPHK